jgi:hypothetical protein
VLHAVRSVSPPPAGSVVTTYAHSIKTWSIEAICAQCVSGPHTTRDRPAHLSFIPRLTFTGGTFTVSDAVVRAGPLFQPSQAFRFLAAARQKGRSRRAHSCSQPRKTVRIERHFPCDSVSLCDPCTKPVLCITCTSRLPACDARWFRRGSSREALPRPIPYAPRLSSARGAGVAFLILGYPSFAMTYAPSDGNQVRCPFCQGSDLTVVKSTDRFTYSRCGGCELVSCVPRLPRVPTPAQKLHVVARRLRERLVTYIDAVFGSGSRWRAR